MQLRRATPIDAPAVAAMEAVCFADPWSESAIATDLAADACRSWIAEEEGAAVGYLLGTRVLDELTVARIASLPSRRRKGVGRRLLEHAIRSAQDGGVNAVFLEVRAGNAAAVALYESTGFSVTRRRRGYYADGEDALDMRRDRQAAEAAS